jgi:hypothetical protein
LGGNIMPASVNPNKVVRLDATLPIISDRKSNFVLAAKIRAVDDQSYRVGPEVSGELGSSVKLTLGISERAYLQMLGGNGPARTEINATAKVKVNDGVTLGLDVLHFTGGNSKATSKTVRIDPSITFYMGGRSSKKVIQILGPLASKLGLDQPIHVAAAPKSDSDIVNANEPRQAVTLNQVFNAPSTAAAVQASAKLSALLGLPAGEPQILIKALTKVLQKPDTVVQMFATVTFDEKKGNTQIGGGFMVEPAKADNTQPYVGVIAKFGENPLNPTDTTTGTLQVYGKF